MQVSFTFQPKYKFLSSVLAIFNDKFLTSHTNITDHINGRKSMCSRVFVINCWTSIIPRDNHSSANIHLSSGTIPYYSVCSCSIWICSLSLYDTWPWCFSCIFSNKNKKYNHKKMYLYIVSHLHTAHNTGIILTISSIFGLRPTGIKKN